MVTWIALEKNDPEMILEYLVEVSRQIRDTQYTTEDAVFQEFLRTRETFTQVAARTTQSRATQSELTKCDQGVQMENAGGDSSGNRPLPGTVQQTQGMPMLELLRWGSPLHEMPSA